MKLNYDLLEEILEHIEEDSDGQSRKDVSKSAVSTFGLSCNSLDVVAYP